MGEEDPLHLWVPDVVAPLVLHDLRKEGKEKRDKKTRNMGGGGLGWVGSLDICSLKEKKGGRGVEGQNKDANKFLSL